MKEITITSNDMAVMPIVNISQAVERRNQLVSFVKEIMVPGIDFGTIPHTNDKAVLLKPGAEKLTTFFGLSKQFEIIERVEDWTGKDHGGELFFYYLYRCRLYRGDLLIAEGDGSCSSFESKYRYRKASRSCPDCGAEAIIKGRAEYGGGWLCYRKKGGCGAKYPDGDPTIEGQEVGRILNEDISDQVNTIQKMAQKRALVAATLLAVNASEFFTQDLEDFDDLIIESESVRVESGKPKKSTKKQNPKDGNSGDKSPSSTQLFWQYQRENGIDRQVALDILQEAHGSFEDGFELLKRYVDEYNRDSDEGRYPIDGEEAREMAGV